MFSSPFNIGLPGFCPLTFSDTYTTGMTSYMYHMTHSTWSLALRGTDCKGLLFYHLLFIVLACRSGFLSYYRSRLSPITVFTVI